MQELIDQILYFLRGIWRYKWGAMAGAWVVCILGWSVLASLPDVYEAKARVYVDTSSEISRLLDEQILDPNIAEEVAYVRQSILGQLQLEKVAAAADLFLDAQNDEERDAIVENLTSNIQIAGSGGNRRGVPDNVFAITYRNPDPRIAREVVETVLDIFIEDTLGGQQNSSDVSRQFVMDQIAEYEVRLEAAEERLANFNRENFDRLPGQQGGYFERLQAETAQLEVAQQSLQQASSRLDRQRQQLRGEMPRVDAGGVIDPNSPEGRIRAQQMNLDELLLRYTESHPDVVAVKETIRRLEDQRDQDFSDLNEDGARSGGSNNPVYQALQISINETEAEVATLQADQSTRTKRIAGLRELIDEISDVEAQSARLNRDYDVIQAQYQSLIDSLERQRLSSEAASSEKVEFRIIDPPKTDPDPVAPMRIAIVPGILVFGIGFGLALALLISQLKPVFENSRMLEMYAGLPVMGTISAVDLPGQAPGGRGRLLGYFACFGLLLGLFVVVFAIEGLGAGFRELITS